MHASAPAPDPLTGAFLQLADQAPEAPLAEGPRGRAARSAVVAAARRVADALEADPAADPAVPVALAGPGDARWPAAWLGVRLAGRPVLMLDETAPGDERERAARAMGADRVLVVPPGGALDDAGDWPIESLDGGAPAPPGTVAIKMTSGSSGEPRGVAVSGEALAADTRQLQRAMQWGDDERFLASVPMSHSYGFSVLAAPVLLGMGVLVTTDGEDPLEVAAAGAATVVPSAPAWYRGVATVDTARAPDCVRTFISAGAPLDPDVAAEFRARHGRGIHVFYGASEVGGITYDRTGTAGERGTLGTPIHGVRVSLLPDPEAGPHAGVVLVNSRGAGIAVLGADDGRLTADGFRTEDLAEWRDGELVLLGRRSAWINVHGRKVDPAEVERIIGRMPGVREVAVTAVPGPAGERVRAVVACDAGSLTWRDVTGHCRMNLAPHKVPRSVVFVEELPRTARGKLDRRALEALGEGDGAGRE